MAGHPASEKTCEIRLTQGFPKSYKAAFAEFSTPQTFRGFQ
jgi:hypothetical protein